MAEFAMHQEGITVSVREQASEITSFYDEKNQIEHMWQGDPAFWSGRNPTLFPIVGSTWDKKIHLNGEVYEMGNHGFARHSLFTCVSHSETEVVMELKDNEETRNQYPFHFTLQNRYTLNKGTLAVETTVQNNSDQVMPFGFGYHPAFNCPFEGDERSAYHLFSNQPETYESQGVKVAGSREISMDPDRLARTIIIPSPASTEYTLSNGRHGLTVHAEGYEWIAFWSPHAPFVCIEPWHSHTDFEIVELPFDKREGTILLHAHETWKTGYSITIF